MFNNKSRMLTFSYMTIEPLTTSNIGCLLFIKLWTYEYFIIKDFENLSKKGNE